MSPSSANTTFLLQCLVCHKPTYFADEDDAIRRLPENATIARLLVKYLQKQTITADEGKTINNTIVEPVPECQAIFKHLYYNEKVRQGLLDFFIYVKIKIF